MPEKEREAQQEIQQKLVLYQLLSQRLEQINEQSRLLEQRLLEVEATRQTLGDLKRLKEGNEVLIPLGSGCYTHGRTGEPGLLLDVGAGVMLKKAPAEAKRFVEEKMGEIEKLSASLQKDATGIVARMNELGPELQAFLQGSR